MLFPGTYIGVQPLCMSKVYPSPPRPVVKETVAKSCSGWGGHFSLSEQVASCGVGGSLPVVWAGHFL